MSKLSSFGFTSKLPDVGTTIFTVMSAMANEYGAINLSQGFPDFEVDKRLVALVERHMIENRNQYAPMAGVLPLREVIGEKVEKMYGKKLLPSSEITICSGATQAINTAITAFIQPGDEVMIFEPAYDSYEPSIKLVGGVVNRISLLAPDFRINWQQVRDAFSSKVKMLILNSPHNPSGTIWTEQDIAELKSLAKDFSFLILSDEVYEHLVYDGQKHHSILEHEQLFDRSMVCFSFGKTLHVTGWKLGYCLAPDWIMQEFRKAHQFQVFSANSPTQYAIADYLRDESTYTGLSRFFQQKRDLFLDALGETPFAFTACAGTYFQVADYSAISDLDDLSFAEWMCKEIGVAVIPLSPFSKAGSQDRVVRFCFAKKEQTLLTAAERLRKLG